VLALGANFRSNVSGSSALPSVPASAPYTGRWQNVGLGTMDNPLGEYVLTSAELMDMYSDGDAADVWVWQW